MSEISDHLAALIAADVAFNRWDLPASLALLTRAPSGELATITVDFPADVWVNQRPSLVLDVIAAAVVQGHPLPVPDNAPDDHAVVGVVLYSETWTLSLAGISQAELDQLDEWAAGRLPDHPRAVETKDLICVTVDGGRHAVEATRGRDGIEVYEGAGVTGGPVDGLTSILAALVLTA
ncbi:hypothetical protein [Agromyces humi]|uniref:hypothetical protein n=1 Tax=Agromyces humi TaxID=1766800 RepID=UPI0013581281|nr:hypothetical protein [Agromyces humi]